MTDARTSGILLHPTSLPGRFRRDGLRVTVTGRVVGASTGHRWGVPLEIYDIAGVRPVVTY